MQPSVASKVIAGSPDSVSTTAVQLHLPSETENTNQTIPKDTRSAWFVCLAGFLVQVLIVGSLHVQGIYFISFLEEFKSTKAKTAWIGSIGYGVGMFFAPLGSFVINKWGPHYSVGLGTILCAISLFTSASVHSIEALFGTYSIMFGFGVALAYTPTMCMASDYFDKYLTVATGIMVAGSSTGTLILSPISQAMIDSIGWRNGFRIHGAAILIICLWSAYAMKPVSKPKPSTPAEYIKKSMARKLMNDLQLWKNKVFLVWVFAIFLVQFGYYIPYVHLVSYASDVGIEPNKGSILVMLLGGFTATGRILFGKVLEWGYLNRLNMHQVSMVLTGTASMLLPFIKSFGGLVAYVVTVGLVDGCYVVLLPVLTTTLVGSGNDSVLAWGYLTLVCSITFSLGPPIAGFIYDATGSYNVPFHIAGIPLLVGAAILFLIPWAQRTADTTNLMSAAHTYSPDEQIDAESFVARSVASTTMTADRAVGTIPEIVLAVDNSFVTIDLDDGESYTVPRRIRRRRRESMCSEVSSCFSDVAYETADDNRRPYVTYSKLDTPSPRMDAPCTSKSQAASLSNSPRVRQLHETLHGSTPQVHLIPNPDREDGFTLTITSPRQALSPQDANLQSTMSNRVVRLVASPRSLIDHPGALATSPPTQVRISCGRTNVTSELQPIHEEATPLHQSAAKVVKNPHFDGSTYLLSSSDISLTTNESFQDVSTGRQPKVRFDSTPNVDLIDQPGPQAPPGTILKKATSSNPDIFPEKSDRSKNTETVAHATVSVGHTNTEVSAKTSILSSNNPFRPLCEANQKVLVSHEPQGDESISQVRLQSSGSNTSSKTLVQSGTNTIDVSAFDPIASPPQSEPQQTAASSSSSYVFIESNQNGLQENHVNISDFDPIVSSPAAEVQPASTPNIHTKSPPTPIPTIPPPPIQPHRRASESRTSESEVFPESSNMFRTQSRTSNPLSPNLSSDGVFGESRQGLDIPAGDASSHDRPNSPTSPDAVAIFAMSDLHLDDVTTDDDA